jgi:type I restriction enzyme S subunit
MKSELVHLGEVVEFINGGAWKQSEYVADGIPVVRVTNMRDGGFDMSDCKFLPPEALRKYAKHQLRHGDLIVATVGSHPSQPGSVVGRPTIARDGVARNLLNQNAVILRSMNDKLDQGWLCCLGRTADFREYIISCARGSANQVRMAIGLLKEMPTKLPPLEQQRKVASILLSYDDLIEVNRRRIAILEGVVQGLFNELFVHPVGERLPIPGDRLQEWVVPRGWSFSSLGKAADITMGQSPPSREYGAEEEGMPFHQGVTDFEGRFHRNRLFLKSDFTWKRAAEKGDVLFSVRAPVGRIAVALEKLALGRGLCAIRDIAGNQAFLLTHLLVSFPTSDMIGGGTIYKAVTKEDIHSIPILQPPNELKSTFEDFASPIWEQLRTLTIANVRLRTVRDLLLPKLISGEIEVATAEEAFAEAAE